MHGTWRWITLPSPRLFFRFQLFFFSCPDMNMIAQHILVNHEYYFYYLRDARPYDRYNGSQEKQRTNSFEKRDKLPESRRSVSREDPRERESSLSKYRRSRSRSRSHEQPKDKPVEVRNFISCIKYIQFV